MAPQLSYDSLTTVKLEKLTLDTWTVLSPYHCCLTENKNRQVTIIMLLQWKKRDHKKIYETSKDPSLEFSF